MQQRKLRFGIIGTAHIADMVIAGIHRADNSELAAVASRDLVRASEWARERDIPHTFGSYDEMLASDVIDAVYIPLPNGLHKEWTVRAVEAGKHVLCEKPLAANAAEVDEIIAAADKAGVQVMEAFMYRFHPQIAKMQELIASGAIGEVRIIRATFGFPLLNPANIRWSKDLSGGALMDVGCYAVNISRLIAGAEPTAAVANAVWSASGVDAGLVGSLEFPGGVLAAVDCSFQTGVSGQQNLTVSGTHGRLHIDLPFRLGEENTVITLDLTDHDDAEEVAVPGAHEYHLMVESFANSVLTNTPLAYDLQNSRGQMRTIDMLYEAARTGHRVTN